MYVPYNAIKTYMSLVLSHHVSALLCHLQATAFFEETMYSTLIGCYFSFLLLSFHFDVPFIFSSVRLFHIFFSLMCSQLCSPCALRSLLYYI
jgi:hypothetical protein